ncbi:hypothetical protein GALMADRAFT_252455 [Galerina marginata CBS 339.88]|uniref:F-box domain-containing protein n=1 Tax=Galerina marginata (strain CBS 339.88) TaxID=685588 RepID=A0A067SQ24_GALM3|nr:hypothetical protein GALMADRAFT_252455 [Galerina marginata CBS 339.88]
MGDFLTPRVVSPFANTSVLNTPNGLGSNDYFASSHHTSTVGTGFQAFGESAVDGRNILFPKLESTEVSRVGSLLDLIPNELLSLVLESGYFDYSEGPTPDTEFRTLSMQISRRFRQQTVHTPSLWSVIYLSQGNAAEEIDQLPLYLERSKEYPLDIQFSCFWNSQLTDPILDLLVPHSKRWRRLSIVTSSSYILSFLHRVNVPILENLDISFYSHERRISLPPNVFGGQTPRLSRLCLRNINLENLDISFRDLETLEIRGYGTWPTFSQFNDMLGGCTSLQRLILHVKPGHVTQQLYANEHHIEQVLLPNLRALEVYSSEWLTSSIVSLIQIFQCPKLESLTLREGVGSASQTARTIMNYTAIPHLPKNTRLSYPQDEPLCTGFPNRLFVQSANVNLATQALSASTLVSLELRKVFLPDYSTMKTMFSTLKNLKHLFFLDIYPNDALRQMLDNVDGSIQEGLVLEMESTVAIPSLETLMLDFHHPVSPVPTPEYSAEFLRVFLLPSLRSLIFKNLQAFQWKNLTDTLARNSSQYPSLSSLKLIDMTDIVPADPTNSHYANIVEAFPYLRRLSLDSVGSNAFVHHLLPDDSSNADIPSLPWPAFEVLSICNDLNASKPLLHRVISTRRSMGRPLKMLCLDNHFSTNAESWNWIREHVESVVQAEAGFL